MAWTEEQIELLRTYWSEGRSASQIAELLGGGLTRNAVIGKAHRLGLASRPSPVRGGDRAPERAEAAAGLPEQGAEGAVRPAGPRPAPVPPPRGADGETCSGPGAAAQPAPASARPARVRTRGPQKPQRVTLLDLNDRICKWPIGHPDEPDFHFCGKPVHPPFPYCAEHCALAYQAQQPRRDRPAGPVPPFRPNLPRPR